MIGKNEKNLKKLDQAEKNENPASQSENQCEKIEKVLKDLECPFSWQMAVTSREDITEYNLNDDEELLPALELLRYIMNIYVGTKCKDEEEEIVERLTVCDDIMVAVRQVDYPEISADVLHYILQSTKCFVYTEFNIKMKLKRVYSKMRKDWKMNSQERSTLLGCKGICWSMYHQKGSAEAEKYMREAIKENPVCDLWYFLLGKILRRRRLASGNATRPSKDELRSFERAYSLSSGGVFGLFLAEVYREVGRPNDSENIYNRILQAKPEGTTVLLRLAFAFIRLRNHPSAEACLRKIGASCTTHSIYFHYRGFYQFTYENYKEADIFLRQAALDNDIAAGKAHLDCAVMLDKPLDVAQYLQDMQKEGHVPDQQTQSLLHLAFTFWLAKRDVLKLLIVHCAKRRKSWIFMSEEDYVILKSETF